MESAGNSEHETPIKKERKKLEIMSYPDNISYLHNYIKKKSGEEPGNLN